MQNFWVKPSEVKSTDKVIGGQQNLLPTMGSVPKPAAGVLDSAYFDMLAATDKAQALSYLKSCGVTWNEHNHAGINWMRAKQALTAALGGQKTVKMSAQVNTQQSSSSQVSAQNNQTSGQKATITLDKATQDELSKCKNGREKVVVLKKKLGNDGCAQYAESLGVTWNKNAHAGINWMRLSEALRNHFDSVDGTSSAVPQSTSKDKSKPTPAPVQPKVDNEVKVPANATQRQKNIAGIINSITSESDLKAFTSVGMVPEDDVSKSFILDKLVPKYAIFASAHGSGNDKNTIYANNPSGFAGKVTEDMKYEGCPKGIISFGLYTLYNDFNMAMLTDPRTQIAPLIGDSTCRLGKSQTTLGMFDRFKDISMYTTDDYTHDSYNGHKIGNYMTNLGYTGSDPGVYEKRYDKEKEGFVRALNMLAEKYPKYKDKCDEMVSDYDTLMKKVHGNPDLLELALSKDSWTHDIDPMKPRFRQTCELTKWGIRNASFSQSNLTVEMINTQYETITKVLKDRGYSDEAIYQTLNAGWLNDNLSRFTVKDENGSNVETLDMSVESAKYGTVLHDTTSNNYWLTYMAGKWSEEHSLNMKPYDYEECKESYNALKQRAEFSGQDFLETQELASKLFGYQFTTVDANTGKPTKVDLTQLPPDQLGNSLNSATFDTPDDPDKDFIMSNLLMMSLEMSVNRQIARYVEDAPRSKINNGEDYSKNFSYYSPDNVKGVGTRSKQSGNSVVADYTLDELNAKIKEQTENLMTYSPEYITDLQNYYNAKANFQDRASEARKANFNSVGVTMSSYTSDPIKDIAYGFTTSIAHHIPRMMEKGKDKLDNLMAKRMDYSPYDFKSVTQRGYGKSNQPKSASNLKALREEAFKAVNCSIVTEDDATSLQMRKDFLKNWDYTDGKDEKTPDGITHSRRMYSGSASFGGADRRALFNSRFFRINNSNMEDDYNDYHSTLAADTSLTASASEELELYHACSYASVAGIIGKTGGWFMGNQYTKVAKALGNGAYFGYKGAKSSVYCGEGSGGYHNTYSSGADGDNANGCYILATCMRGKDGDSKSDHGRFRDYEIAIKTNKCIKPHHFVDISARCMNINVNRDSQGNYLDPKTGKITHDRYGKSVTMQ